MSQPTSSMLGWQTFTPSLMHATESGDYCPTCDLGSCDNETAGWAYWREVDDWLTGCDDCLRNAAQGGSSVTYIADILAVFFRIDQEASHGPAS